MVEEQGFASIEGGDARHLVVGEILAEEAKFLTSDDATHRLRTRCLKAKMEQAAGDRAAERAQDPASALAVLELD